MSADAVQDAPQEVAKEKEVKGGNYMDFSFLISGILSITWQQAVMYVVGAVLIYLAIEKGFEPSLLMPMGFGAILVNLPLSGVIDQISEGVGETHGIIDWLFDVGIEASEAMPILLFIGIGAMIDFGPLLANPKLFLCGAAAQAGIFLTIIIASALGFEMKDAASIGIIGAADGPTSILVSQTLGSNYIGAIDHQEGARHAHALPSPGRDPSDASAVPHLRLHHRRPGGPLLRGSGGLPDVRQPDP